MRDADLVIAIGSRLDEMTTGGYTVFDVPVPRQKLVHVQAAAEDLGRVYQATLPIVSGMGKFVEALATWREYLAQHPADPDWSQVQQQVIDTEYALALDKYEAKEYDAARKLHAEFQAKYPLDRHNAAIVVLLGQMDRQQRKSDAKVFGSRNLAFTSKVASSPPLP